jgi:hypothetical protein
MLCFLCVSGVEVLPLISYHVPEKKTTQVSSSNQAFESKDGCESEERGFKQRTRARWNVK